MNRDLYALSYFSRNSIEPSADRLAAEIQDILGKARENNRLHEITGALLFSSGCFAQVLEGPQREVEQVFELIQCDPRHRDVTVLSFEPIDERAFPNWSMAYAGVPAPGEPVAELDGILPGPGEIPARKAGQDLVVAMQDLIARHQGVAQA